MLECKYIEKLPFIYFKLFTIAGTLSHVSCSLVISQMTWLCIFMVALVTLFIVFKYINQYKKKITNRINYTKRAFSGVSSLVISQMGWFCTFIVALITLFILELKFRIDKMNINYRNWINYTERAFSGVSSFVFSQVTWMIRFKVAFVTLLILEIKYNIIKEYKKNNW